MNYSVKNHAGRTCGQMKLTTETNKSEQIKFSFNSKYAASLFYNLQANLEANGYLIKPIGKTYNKRTGQKL